MMWHKQEGIAGRDGEIGCGRARELFYDLADAELSNDDRRVLSLHEASCSNCGPEFREWRMLRNALQNSRMTPAENFKAGVMARIQEIQPEMPTRSISWAVLCQQSWAKGVAVAAVVLALMAGAARLPAAGSLVSRLHNDKPQVAVQIPTTPLVNPQNGSGPIDPNATNKSSGNDNTAKPNKASSDNQVRPSATPGGKPLIASNGSGKPGDRVFLSKKRVNTTTTIKVTVDNIDQARSDALSTAQGFNTAGLSSETPTQNNGHPILFLRFTVDPGQAAAFSERLGSLGKIVSKNNESEDVTDKFARALQDYQALKAQQAAAQDADKQQYDSRITQLEQQLQNWDDNSGKQVVLLWLEQ